jgi:hypothetical protein
VKFFTLCFSINILHVYLTSPICRAAVLTAFKLTHYMLDLWRAMRHWDRFFVRRLGVAYVGFRSLNVARTHTHTHTHIHISCGDGKICLPVFARTRVFIHTLILVCIGLSVFPIHAIDLFHLSIISLITAATLLERDNCKASDYVVFSIFLFLYIHSVWKFSQTFLLLGTLRSVGLCHYRAATSRDPFLNFLAIHSVHFLTFIILTNIWTK